MSYLAPSYFARTYFGGLGVSGPAVAADPFLFEPELIDFVAGRLGVQVSPNGLPAEGGLFPMLVMAAVDGDTFPLLHAAGRSYLTIVQFDAWGSDYREVKALAARLVSLLHCYRGPLGAGFIQSSVAHRQLDAYEPASDPDRSGGGLYRSLREFRVVWTAPPG